ncbi:hypothetical protein FZC78_21295 [Rossellomorea vietnamensis]|uniref:Uncharacterized protein n=2 Tax=Rossellomorea vietnamensis TaxID=218284 RepID=A0A5D4NIZ5_9BACI|nr:hypothetical protein FZC78_21295 [Rossellomorea vietnamensis]
MNNKLTGLTLVLTGLVLLMLSITLQSQTSIWVVLLGASIVLNISGASLLFKFLKESVKTTN